MRKLLPALMKTGGGSLAGIGLGALIAKLIAAMAGPAGLGIYSILRQFQLTLVNVATLQGNTAIVQGFNSREESRRPAYLFSSAVVIVALTVLVCITLWFFAHSIAAVIFGHDYPQGRLLVRGLIPTVICASAALYLGAVLNSHRALGRLAMTTVWGNAVGVLCALPVMRFVPAPLDFLMLLTIISIGTSGASLFFIVRSGWLQRIIGSWRQYWETNAARYFVSYSSFTFLAAFIGTGSLLLVRLTIVHYAGLSNAGIFDSSWTMSGAYVMLVLSSLSTYYMPVLSSSEKDKRGILIRQVFQFVTLALTPLIVGVILGKGILIRTLYTKGFLNTLDLWQWMLIGDYFKGFGWVLATPMLSVGDVQLYLSVEAGWYLIFTAGVFISVSVFHEIWSIGLAFLLANVSYCAVCYIYTVRRHGLRLTRRNILTWLAGLILIVISSLASWNHTTTNWIAVAVMAALLPLFAWLLLTPAQRNTALVVLQTRLKERVAPTNPA